MQTRPPAMLKGLAMLGLLALGVTGCSTGSPARDVATGGSDAPTGISASASPGPADLPTVRTYDDACRLNPQVCHDVTGTPPDVLWRPLDIPDLLPSGQCPVTTSALVPDGLPFGGYAVDTGTPVRAVLARDAADQPAIAHAAPGSTDGWHSVKTLFFAPDDDLGPVLIRGGRVDPGPADVAFGANPTSTNLLVPPGRGTNLTGGYRQWPGGLHVRSAGCYYVQVDGPDSSGGFTVEVALADSG